MAFFTSTIDKHHLLWYTEATYSTFGILSMRNLSREPLMFRIYAQTSNQKFILKL